MNAAAVSKPPSLALMNKVLDQLATGWRGGAVVRSLHYADKRAALYSYELKPGPDGQVQLIVTRQDGKPMEREDQFRVASNEAYPDLLDVLSSFIREVDQLPADEQAVFETAVIQALSVLRRILR